MSLFGKDLRKKSPLDLLKSKHRTSTASDNSQECTILDGFPIPEDYNRSPTPSFQNEFQDAQTKPELNNPPEEQNTGMYYDPSPKIDDDAESSSLRSGKSQKTVSSQLSQTERRYKRYGHSYNTSVQENLKLYKPDLLRSHSASRSWDASQAQAYRFPE